MHDGIKLTLFGVLIALISIPLGVFGQWNQGVDSSYAYVFTAVARYALLFGIFAVVCGLWLIIMRAFDRLAESIRKNMASY